MEAGPKDRRHGETHVTNVGRHLCPGTRSHTQGFSGRLDEVVVSPLVKEKKPPDKRAQGRICSCCTYSSAGKKTIIHSSGNQHKLLTMPVVINKTTQERALVDSGASDNFIHQETARSLGLKLQNKKEPQAVNDIQGRNLGWISHYVTVLLEAAHHQEEIDLNVVPLGIHGLVVGLPWLQKHNPDIEWREKRIKFSSPFCKWKCIKKAYERLRDDKGKFTPWKDQVQLEDTNGTEHMELDAILPNSTERHGSEQHESMKGVPAEYHDFADVFNLEEARTMPKDRGLWNFKIDFIEGWEDKLPKPARRYRLSADEQEARTRNNQGTPRSRNDQALHVTHCSTMLLCPKERRD
jgi:hypothetical protein